MTIGIIYDFKKVYIDQKDIEELDGSALDEILKKHGPM